MKSKITYIFAIGITLYLALLYDYASIRFLLMFLLLLLPVMGIWILVAASKVKVTLCVPQSTVFRNEKLEVRLTANNRSFFPVPRIKVIILERDLNSGEETELSMEEMVDGREKITYTRNCEAMHCGRCVWRVDKIRIYDYLGLLYRRISNTETWEIQILPNLYKMNIAVLSETRGHYWEEPEYDKNFPGDDVSEIFQIREYRMGDSMQRIHWKMTAKEDTLMVKDYGKPVESVLMLLLDAKIEDQKAQTAQILDNFFELSASLSASLLEEGYIHQVGWYQGGEFQTLQIGHEEDFQIFLGKLISMKTKDNEKLSGEKYHTMFPHYHKNTCYLLDTQLHLLKNGDLHLDFSKISKENWEGYQVIL